MMDGLSDFESSVCRQGYKIITSREPHIEAAGRDFDPLRPFEFNGLFARFANASTRAKMLEFCNRYGLPLGQSSQTIVARDRFRSRIYNVGLEILQYHQMKMQRAVHAFERGEVSEIMKVCNVTESIASTRIQLRRNAAGKLELYFEPPNLLGAMWLQFARLVCSGGQLFRCVRCSAPIAVGAGTGRRNTAMFCTNACKVAAHKLRTRPRRHRPVVIHSKTAPRKP